jgi:thiamine biosynthesis lipoprotein
VQERTFRAMNTEWWVRAYGATPRLLDDIEALVRDIEARLTRFDTCSALSRLNRERSAEDSLLATVVRSALDWREATSGVFDPGVGAALVAAGYDRSFESVQSGLASYPEPVRPSVNVTGDRVTLDGEGTLDLGGIGKGWAVDAVADYLEAIGVDRYLVDGGGDLRAGNTPSVPWPVGVGDGLVAWLGPGAVATSSTANRRWVTASGTIAHHVIDTATGSPAFRGVQTAVVTHNRATTADVLATTLVAGGTSSLDAVRAHGANALIQGDDGAWWMTRGMGAWLDRPTLV